MKLTTGIQREMARIEIENVPLVPKTIEGMVDVLGGSREAVKALGTNPDTHKPYAQRDIQRYENYEKYGKTPSNRRPSADARQKLENAAFAKLQAEGFAKIQAAGIKVRMEDVEMLDPSGKPIGTRDIDIVLTGDALAKFLDAWQLTILGTFDLDDTAEVFNEVVMEEWGFPGAAIDAGGSAVPSQSFSLTLAR